MVLVPAGCFVLGSTDEQIEYAINELGARPDWVEDEQPAEEHCIDEPFWIDRYEVTNEDFALFLNEQGNQTAGGVEYLDAGDADANIERIADSWQAQANYENHPVIEVSWYGGRDFCDWRQARLPTEREWEYTAGGPDNLIYPWGDEWNGSIVNTYANIGADNYQSTAPVNAFLHETSWVGAEQMSGNVSEWTNSIYKPYPYDIDVRQESSDFDRSRVLRGGSWGVGIASFFRTIDRNGELPVLRGINEGFRCARSVYDS
jgi:formylglycine-generating enzyme required for sulfatase activity